MIRKIAWDTFKNTGDINTFLELKQIENMENKINNEEKINNTLNTENYINNKNQKVD
jgi:hypothetical protein